MSISTDADREAVLEVIRAELTAFWNGDLEAWSRCFVHVPEAWFLGYWRHGGLALRHGWEDIRSRAAETMLVMKGTAAEFAAAAIREELVIRVGGDTAWVSFKQRYSVKGSPFSTKRGPGGFTQELRILERHAGQWKYVVLMALDPGLEGGDGPMFRLDGEGRIIWKSDDADAALEADNDLVVRSGRLRIRNRSADRKLQMAIAWAAGLDRGLMASRASVPIVMDAGEGLPTKLWWLTADSGMILFAFNQPQMTSERLAMSAAIYGLSPAQQRLVQRIVDGSPLSDIARQTNASENTLRTHLRRVFAKVGVHNQPALIRVLLSVSMPR